MGRHIIGYEAQKVWAAVDFFEKENSALQTPVKIGMAGHAEDGLIGSALAKGPKLNFLTGLMRSTALGLASFRTNT